GTACTLVDAVCVTGVLKYCGAGSNLEFSINCAVGGWSCGVDPKTKSTDCLTDGDLDLCGNNTASQCDGDTVKACTSDRFSTFHCAALGGSCLENGTTAVCTRPGDVCTPFDADVNQCDGSTVKLCVGGQPVDFDCSSIGRDCMTVPVAGCL